MNVSSKSVFRHLVILISWKADGKISRSNVVGAFVYLLWINFFVTKLPSYLVCL